MGNNFRVATLLLGANCHVQGPLMATPPAVSTIERMDGWGAINDLAPRRADPIRRWLIRLELQPRAVLISRSIE